MFPKRSSAYKTDFRRKGIFQKVLLGAIILILLSLLPAVYFKLQGHGDNERRELREFFNSGIFEKAYTQSREMLVEKPIDFYLLTIHGFSAYQLAIAQINSFDTLSYVNDCIWSLRKAMLFREGASDARIFYVLGKAYYNKGSWYADLAVNYLEKAKAANYAADDIPEYLGLAYAAIRDYRSSVAAFAEALTRGPDPSDILLLSIARSYQAIEEYESARAYLIRCLEISRDSSTIAAARLLHGNVLVTLGDFPGAEAEYQKVLEENSENAEAHFQMGELFFLCNDPTRARAEWRRAIRINPAHAQARSRLNIQ